MPVELGKKPGMLGEVFKKARPDIQNPATLKRLIFDLIEPENWMAMDADVKRGRRLGKEKPHLRAVRLLGHHQEQAVEFPATCQNADEDQRALCHRRAG